MRQLGYAILTALLISYIKTSNASMQPLRHKNWGDNKYIKKRQWEIPSEGLKYSEYLKDAEYIYRLPPGLLARVAWQESRFRPDIIYGKTVSNAGAVGIMQIIPKWHPEVDPLNPRESIYYAASYLRKLYNRFGTWELALAAYNWGQGNLSRKGIENAPRETKNYIAQILTDINVG